MWLCSVACLLTAFQQVWFQAAIVAAIPASSPVPPSFLDLDMDGFPSDVDCNDNDASIHPNAPEICEDGIDNNCDGQVDELPCLVDADLDGFWAVRCYLDNDSKAGSLHICQSFQEAFPTERWDCNDTDASINPEAIEICGDGIDNDCDGIDAICPRRVLQRTTVRPSKSAKPSTSYFPSSRPSRKPSGKPSRKPSSRPSRKPSSRPSKHPSTEPRPTPTPSISYRPTAAAFQNPTAAVSTSVPNITVVLGMAKEMSNAAIGAFVHTFESFYRDFYQTPRRRLAAKGQIKNFNTTVTIQRQQLTNDGLQVLYVQNLAYRKQVASTLLPKDVITDPFTTAANLEQLKTNLKRSNSEFANLTSISSPAISSGGGSGSGGLSLGIIIAIAVGGVLALGIVLFVAFKFRSPYKPHRDDRAETLPTSDDPPRLVKGDSFHPFQEEMSAVSDPILEDLKSAAGRGDQSVETVDYDYTKAYGGEMSVVSSAGGTMGENTREAGSAFVTERLLPDRAVLGASFDSDTTGSNSRTETLAEEQVIEIFAPPGKLGVVIDTPETGAPLVHAIKDSSVIGGVLSVGDQLLMVDEVDVSRMTAMEVSKLISQRAANPSRKLTVARKVTAHR